MSDQESIDYIRAAERWFEQPGRFGAAERRIVTNAARRLAMAEDPNRKFDSEATIGDRLADRVARFGGSWTIQAPIIMMSQNRQAYKDRRMATHDYEVNLKAEIEILALHEKLDSLRAPAQGSDRQTTAAARAADPTDGTTGAEH